MPFGTVMQFLNQSEKNTWWLLLHPPNQPFSLARPSSILPAAQKRCEGLLCIQKKFLTFSIPRDVGNSFLRVTNRSASNGLYLISHSFWAYACVLFYLRRTLYILYGNHVQLYDRKVSIRQIQNCSRF